MTRPCGETHREFHRNDGSRSARPILLDPSLPRAGTRPAVRSLRGENAPRRRRPGLFGRHSTGMTMTTNRRSAGVMGVVLAFDQRGDFDGLRRRMLMLLGVWIAYFVIVEAFIRTLGRAVVRGTGGAGMRADLSRRALSARAARARSVGAAFVSAASSPRRHGRAGRRPCPGHPSTVSMQKTWMAVTSTAMTEGNARKSLIFRAFCHISQMRHIIDLAKPSAYGPRGFQGAGRGFSPRARHE